MLNSFNKSFVFCISPLVNQSLTWDSEIPLLTECFTQTVLPLIPLIALLVLLPYDLYVLKILPKTLAPIPYQWRNISILLTITCLTIISIIKIAKTFWKYFANEINLLIISELLSPTIKLLTYILLAILVLLYRTCGYRHSNAIPIQWLFSLVISSISLYQFFATNDRNINTFDAIFNCFEVLLTFKSFIISCLTQRLSAFERLGAECGPNCPFYDYNVFSRLFFVWLRPVLIKGFKSTANLSDYLIPICYYLRSKHSFNAFETADKKYNSRSGDKKLIKLLPLIWSTTWLPYTVSALLQLLEIATKFIEPYVLSKLIDFVSSNDEHRWHGFYYAVLYCFSSLSSMIIDCHSYALSYLAAFRVRTALRAAIYSKMLKLSPSSRREYTTGDINNIMGVDIEEIVSFFPAMSQLFVIPISLSIGLYILWQYLGPSSLTLVVIMLTVGPFTTFIMKRIDVLQTKQMELKDKRMEQISEVLNNIKLLKLFGWEQPFSDRVTHTRDKELSTLMIAHYYWSSMEVLWTSIAMIISGISFAVFTLIAEQVLTAKKAFVSLSVFNILRQPVARFPNVLTHSVRAYVSFKRIRKYLSSEEIDENENQTNEDFSGDNDCVVCLKDCSFTWSLTDQPVLNNIDFNVKKGSLIAIVGRVGAGKSSLFSALLGDMYRTAGQRTPLLGSVAYVPQSAWIQNKTLKDNITFVSDFDESKYESIITACALKPDFDSLPARDMTEIGEKGINLSGGQKHRVSLARAVYQDSDVYLLDDPLSAVDAHVAQHLFQEVIGSKGLLHKKTRILATHNISFLKEVNHIVVMRAGKIIGAGSYDELSEKGLLSEQVLNDSEDNDEEEDNASEDILIGSGDLIQRQRSRLSSNNTLRQISRQMSVKSDSTDGHETVKERMEREAKSAQLIDEETQEFGNIKYTVYLDYFRRCGLWFILIALFGTIGYNTTEVGANYWLNVWTSKNSTQIKETTNESIAIYLSAVFANSLFVFIAQVSLRYGSLKAGKRLHKDMLSSILRSPLSFFDVTPLGRIINRFNKDIASIDEEIEFALGESVSAIIYFCIILATVLYTIPYLLIEMVFITIGLVFLYKIYLWTSRQLHRLDSITRSPIYSHFNESIAGAVSLRAYKVQQIFINKLHDLNDININIEKHEDAAIEWIDIWTAIIGTIITFSAASMVVMEREIMSPGLAGFIFIYSGQVFFGIAWALRIAAQLEIQMVSVERVREYSQLESEAEWESIDDYKPDANWPSNPSIEFINYSASYRPGLEPVLKNLNFKVQSGERVGIVGRTGAGKSSMTLALFRIIEPTIGKIVIDGLDVTKIGLHDLRSKLTIIPQEPNLFAGTLRLNLDPFDHYSDQQLWTALERSHLKDFVSDTSEGLLYEITESGDNLSAGQRQLVCLSRALLRETKILVLDEATAACDLETDLLIQSTIKEQFNDCTVFTIAHRLNTVIDYNTILVLDNGVIVEKDSPKNLLKNSKSVFYSLAKEFGIV